MKKIYGTSILFFLSLQLLTGQIYYGGSSSTLGTLNLQDCSAEYYPRPSFPDPFMSFSDVTFTPDGRLIGVSWTGGIQGPNASSVLAEIFLEDVVRFDTILVIEGFSFNSLTCAENGLLYLGGRTLQVYDLFSEQLTILGFLPGWHALGGDLLWYEGSLFGSVFYLLDPLYAPLFTRFEISSTEGITMSILSDELPGFTGLAKNLNTSTEELEIIGCYNNILSTTVDSTEVFTVSLSDTTYNHTCTILTPENRGAVGLTSADEFRTNLSLRLDLDADDSSGRFIDHFWTNGACSDTTFLADDDPYIRTSITAIDSLVVDLQSGILHPGAEFLSLSAVPEHFTLSGNESTHLVLTSDGLASTDDYLEVIRQIAFNVDVPLPTEGVREVAFELYKYGIPSDPAIAFVQVQEDEGLYAGEDYTLDLCVSYTRNLFNGLGEDVFRDGYWYPALQGNNPNYFDPLAGDTAGVYYYIAAQGTCLPDTAAVTVNTVEPAALNYGGTMDVVQGVMLCEGDTVLWELDPEVLQSWQWYTDGSTTDTERLITGPVIEGYYYLDVNGCDGLVRTSFEPADWEGLRVERDTVERCAGTTLNFYGMQVSSDTTLCVPFASTSDCDYTRCRTFYFTPVLELPDSLTLCEGEAVMWNGILLTEAGDYEYFAEGQNGNCDTLQQLHLELAPTYERNLVVGLSPGGSYTVGDMVFTEAGLYTIPLLSELGCDSIIHLEIEIANSVEEELAFTCAFPNLLLKGQQDWQPYCESAVSLQQWALRDAQGRLVLESGQAQMMGEVLLPKSRQLQLSAGIYFYELLLEYEGQTHRQTGKLVLLE